MILELITILLGLNFFRPFLALNSIFFETRLLMRVKVKGSKRIFLFFPILSNFFSEFWDSGIFSTFGIFFDFFDFFDFSGFGIFSNFGTFRDIFGIFLGLFGIIWNFEILGIF